MQTVCFNADPLSDGRRRGLAHRAEGPIAHAHVDVIRGRRPLVLLDCVAEQSAANCADDAPQGAVVVSRDTIAYQGPAEPTSNGTHTVGLTLNLNGVDRFDHAAVLARGGCYLRIARLLRDVAVLAVAVSVCASLEMSFIMFLAFSTIMRMLRIQPLLVAPPLIVALHRLRGE